MIQRIQSVFLIIVGVCMICTFFFPVLKKSNSQGSVELTYIEMTYTAKANNQKKTTKTFYMAILAAVAAVISLFSVSKFKNRLLQMKLGLLNSVVMCGILGFTMYFISQGEKMIGSNLGYQNFTVGFYLPIVGLISNILANRFIRKDEKLVRESDRMR
ncbi:MAG TPA: DUF4293 domain-containing protein [Microscillaceae bacterium]|nr:DUF4293 domain-containing protein [Microscillaceae bacterium]